MCCHYLPYGRNQIYLQHNPMAGEGVKIIFELIKINNNLNPTQTFTYRLPGSRLFSGNFFLLTFPRNCISTVAT